MYVQQTHRQFDAFREQIDQVHSAVPLVREFTPTSEVSSAVTS